MLDVLSQPILRLIFTIFTGKKKNHQIFHNKTKYRAIIFFLANIFSTYFSPSTFSPKKFSHFFHNPQDSLAARLTHSLTHHTNPKKDKKNAKNATKFNHHHHHKKIHAFN